MFSILSSVGNAISSGINAVCETVSKVGSAVSDFAHAIKPVLGPILQTVTLVLPHPLVKVVAGFANALLHTLTIFRPEESVQDIGDRALQAADDGITQDGYDNFDDYMSALRDFQLDPEASKKFSDADKLIAGLGVATSGLEAKFEVAPGSLNDVWLLPLTNSDYFTADRVKGMLETGKTIGNVSAYLDERMSGAQASEFRKNYEFTPDGKPMNNSQLGDLYTALDQAKSDWTSLKSQLKGND